MGENIRSFFLMKGIRFSTFMESTVNLDITFFYPRKVHLNQTSMCLVSLNKSRVYHQCHEQELVVI